MSDTHIRPALSFDPTTNHTIGAGDCVGIDGGENGTINQVCAVYNRTLTNPGAIKLGSEFDGNIYCLVVSTNSLAPAKAAKQPDLKQTARR